MLTSRPLVSLVFSVLAISLIGASPATRTAAAAKTPLVLELFSSQNCEACPRANALMGELVEEPGLLVLTYGVDYWDYLGWTDTFAQPDFVSLQKRYADAFGLRGPYTPQLVINGAFQCSGAKRQDVEKKMAMATAATRAQSAGPNPAPSLKLRAMDGPLAELVIESRARPDPLDIWAVEYVPGLFEVTPKSGSNRGRDLIHFNVVKSRTLIGKVSGGSGRYVIPCEAGCAVLVQAPDQGPILTASWIEQAGHPR